MDFLNLAGGPTYTMGLVGIFTGFCLLASGLYNLVFQPFWWRRRLQRRLQGSNRERLSRIQILRNVQELDGSLVVALAQKLGGWGKIENLQRRLLQADIYWHPGTFLSLAGLLACTAFILVSSQVGVTAALPAGIFLGYLPFFFVRVKRNRKTRIIEKQMPETMELLSRSMRAGHALPSAIELASKEVSNPLGGEMRIVFEEQRLGLGMNDALKRLGERVASQDLQYFITAVMLQTETGGNLAEILENIGYLIRERLKLKGKIQALTAEGRFSALILALLPFIIFVAINLISRDYMTSLLEEPSGHKIIGAGMVSICLGILWMKNIIKIKV